MIRAVRAIYECWPPKAESDSYRSDGGSRGMWQSADGAEGSALRSRMKTH